MKTTDKIVVYPNASGGVEIVFLDKLANLPNLGSQQLAQRETPSGKPYRILDIDTIPKDELFRNAWYVDFSKTDGYGRE